MSGQEKTKVLIKGTAILAAAALFSKVLGVLYRIPYQNITGNIGFYVYQQVYPIYSLLLILATAGFPIAISKLVAERLAFGDKQGAKRVFKVAVSTLTLTGLFFFVLLFVSAPLLASWMEDQRLILPIRSVSSALLVVPVMAAIRGYFQGFQNMVPTAVSQTVEQVVRVTTILLLSYWFIYHGYDVYYAGAGAVFGAFTGAVAALLVLLFFWKKVEYKKNKQVEQEGGDSPEHEGSQSQVGEQYPEQDSYWILMRKILYLSIPICLGAMVLPLFQLVDSMSVVKVLIHSNWDHLLSREMKGIYDRGQPLVQFSAFFVTALALALVPSISEAHAKQDTRLIAARSAIAMKLTLFIGLAASFGLAIIAAPVNVMLYRTDEGTLTLAVLAFTTIFSTMGITSAAILQGLGQVMLPARNLFVGVIVKLILNLVFIPMWDITGAALATVLAYGVATLLNMWSLYRFTRIQLSFKLFFAKPFAAVCMMSLCVWLTMEGLLYVLQGIDQERIYYTLVALSSVCLGALVYVIALLRLGAVTRSDIQSIPKVSKCIPLLERFKILHPK